MPIEEKKKYANILIGSNGELVKTKNQVDELVKFLKII